MQNKSRISSFLFLFIVLLNEVHKSDGYKRNMKCYMCNSAIGDCVDDGECPTSLEHDRNCHKMEENPKAGENYCYDYKKEYDRQQKVLGVRAQKWIDHIKKSFPDKSDKQIPHIFEDTQMYNTFTFCMTTAVYYPNAFIKTDVIVREPFVHRGCTKDRSDHPLGKRVDREYTACYYMTYEGATMETCYCDHKDLCNDEYVGAGNNIFPSLILVLALGLFSMFRTKEIL